MTMDGSNNGRKFDSPCMNYGRMLDPPWYHGGMFDSPWYYSMQDV